MSYSMYNKVKKTLVWSLGYLYPTPGGGSHVGPGDCILAPICSQNTAPATDLNIRTPLLNDNLSKIWFPPTLSKG